MVGCVDPDTLFGFTTAKVVKLRNWKLGAANLVILLAFFCGAIGYSMVWKCNHLLLTESRDSPMGRGSQTEDMKEKFGPGGLNIPSDYKTSVDIPLGVQIRNQTWVGSGPWLSVGETTNRSFADIGDFPLAIEDHDDIFDDYNVTELCKQEYPRTLRDAFNRLTDNGAAHFVSEFLRDLSIISEYENNDMAIMRLMVKLAKHRMTISRNLSNEAEFHPFGSATVQCKVHIEIQRDPFSGETFRFHLKRNTEPYFAIPEDGHRVWYGILFFPVDFKGLARRKTFSWAKFFAFAAGYSFLLTISHMVVRNVALFVLPEKREYNELVVELSKDFHPNDWPEMPQDEQ